MIGTDSELAPILRQFNPWWSGGRFPDLPAWRRTAFARLDSWLAGPPAGRAVLLSGARQVGKTTLLLQAVEALRQRGVPSANILYATFDHPLLKLAGPDVVLRLWREQEIPGQGPEYLLLDEIQSVRDWQVWLKYQVDFQRVRRIVATGSALALAENAESGVGRWTTLRIPTLSFGEYLRLRGVQHPSLPLPADLSETAGWSPGERTRVAAGARILVGHFHEHLLRGGFPQTATVDTVTLAQKLLREDILDRVLGRDMPLMFGVRRVLELEQVFLYLCLHDGGLLDLTAVGTALQLARPTVGNFIGHLEAAHLIYRLLPHGYGKQVLRAQPKIYLADPAIAPSVLLRGKALLDDADGLARAVEAAAFKHLVIRHEPDGARFAYWRSRREREVDIVVEATDCLQAIEVKYRSGAHTRAADLRGLIEFCSERPEAEGIVLTRDLEDFGPLDEVPAELRGRILRVPAMLACLWLSG